MYGNYFFHDTKNQHPSHHDRISPRPTILAHPTHSPLKPILPPPEISHRLLHLLSTRNHKRAVLNNRLVQRQTRNQDEVCSHFCIRADADEYAVPLLFKDGHVELSD